MEKCRIAVTSPRMRRRNDRWRIDPVTDVERDEMVALYESVGWSAYTKAPALLYAAIAGSSYVVTARRGE